MSNINEVNLSSPIKTLLSAKQNPQYIGKLQEANIKTIHDLLWIFPNKIYPAPQLQSFTQLKSSELFLGEGKIIGIQSKPQFGRKGKKRIQLFQMTCTVKDNHSAEILSLKWFNIYPSQTKKLKNLDNILFQGEVSVFNNSFQIVNPQILETMPEKNNSLIRQYPTVNGVSGHHIQKLIDKIPSHLWNQSTESLPEKIINKYQFMSVNYCFRNMHGLSDEWNKEILQQATNRLIYQEFFHEQIKIKARKDSLKKKNASVFHIDESELNKFIAKFPYQLTQDQISALKNITDDLKSSHPMMRMLQGDVGCGKTTIAFLACLIIAHNQQQVVIMAPTETLAQQHYNNFKKNFAHLEIEIDCLFGSHTQKEKKEIYSKIKSGETKIVFGTHSLFQEAVEYKNLALAIIDEQHKFGVEQRLKLLSKGKNIHCLTMSATPIPRTLCLTQYGDLDISLIKSMPSGRKMIQTRIVEPSLSNKYLSFLKTRIEKGEQAYIVVPAIEESEKLDLNNVNSIYERYKMYYPHYRIEILHGKLSSEEKNNVISKFLNKEIQILISTSVIEVGIDVHNATVMSIYNPERFGLSSLHQLRGRVGRGGKAGFCFLVLEQPLSPESMHRLQVVESTLDGFKIAQADLEIRGHGDLFGKEQSGSISGHKIANIVTHSNILYSVCNDLDELITNHDSFYLQALNNYKNDFKISTTI